MNRRPNARWGRSLIVDPGRQTEGDRNGRTAGMASVANSDVVYCAEPAGADSLSPGAIDGLARYQRNALGSSDTSSLHWSRQLQGTLSQFRGARRTDPYPLLHHWIPPHR